MRLVRHAEAWFGWSSVSLDQVEHLLRPVAEARGCEVARLGAPRFRELPRRSPDDPRQGLVVACGAELVLFDFAEASERVQLVVQANSEQMQGLPVSEWLTPLLDALPGREEAPQPEPGAPPAPTMTFDEQGGWALLPAPEIDRAAVRETLEGAVASNPLLRGARVTGSKNAFTLRRRDWGFALKLRLDEEEDEGSRPVLVASCSADGDGKHLPTGFEPVAREVLQAVLSMPLAR